MIPSYSMRALIMNKVTANMRFKVTGEILLPKRTPSGAHKIEMGTTHTAVRTFTSPKVPMGASAGVAEMFMKIMSKAPGTHTKSETADEVPMQV